MAELHGFILRGVTNHLHPLEWSSKYMEIHQQLNPHSWPSSKHDTLENWHGTQFFGVAYRETHGFMILDELIRNSGGG